MAYVRHCEGFRLARGPRCDPLHDERGTPKCNRTRKLWLPVLKNGRGENVSKAYHRRRALTHDCLAINAHSAVNHSNLAKAGKHIDAVQQRIEPAMLFYTPSMVNRYATTQTTLSNTLL